MKSLRFSAIAVMLLAVAGGCSEAPTTATLPGSARFDGLGVGSGHVVPTENTDVAPDGTVTLAGDTTSRGGLGVGSGH